MWCTLYASACMGQSGVPVASWCMVWPILPFFWFVIFMVATSQDKSEASGAERGTIRPFLKKPMFLTLNCFVRELETRTPFTIENFGRVYSPTLRRKKKATNVKQPAACNLGFVLCIPAWYMCVGTVTGTARLGIEGGSSLR